MTDTTTSTKRPLVSVVLDGYNESRSLGTAKETVEALKQQDFPLYQVEVILVGSAAQTNEWVEIYSHGTPFLAVKTVTAEGAHYYELKNRGAQIASGEIIAFTDSDVYPKPTWLSSIVEGIRNGADVVVGLSLFKSSTGWNSDAALRQVAVSISFGWIIGKNKDSQTPPAVGFLDHNVAFRANTFRRHQYRTDLGRICGAPLLYRALTNTGAKIALQPKQQVVHYFSWYWFSKVHFRFGYEIFLLRRLDKAYPNQWIVRTKVFEPLVTMVWHVLLDVPRWFRFSNLLRTSLGRRLLLLPIVMVMSIAARASEMAGMYSTLLAPNVMRRWAESF